MLPDRYGSSCLEWSDYFQEPIEQQGFVLSGGCARVGPGAESPYLIRAA
jgi:hypothetical protein